MALVEVGARVRLPDGREGTVLTLQGAPLYATVEVETEGRWDNVGIAADELVTDPIPVLPEEPEPEPEPEHDGPFTAPPPGPGLNA